MDEQLRAWWWARQGLDGSTAGAGAAEVLERTGWSRSVGGSGPYLALFARAGLTRETVDGDLAALKLHELPAARGCTYVVPACDFGLALRASQGHADSAAIATAKKYLGVTDKELYKLCDALADALDGKVLDPRELKSVLGGAARSLGPEGKKRGTSTTLPLALGKLQTEGLIRRVSVNGRLDQQRYGYTLWKSPPQCTFADDEVAVELARRYFRWSGPATASQLAWWAGLGAKAAKSAMAALNLVPLAEGDERMMFPADLDALRSLKPAKSPQLALVGSMDNLSHLRRDAAALLEAADAEITVLIDRGLGADNALSDFAHHAIVDRGRVIGYWEFDASVAEIAWGTFAQAPAELKAEVTRVENFVRDQLGDARSFSLDSPDSRTPRIAAVKQLGDSLG